LSEIRFYLDENMNVEIAEQLKRIGIDAITARDLDQLGDSDKNHLQRATQMGRVLCTQDHDYLRMNAAGVEHSGIAFGEQYLATIGGWVKALRRLHETTTAEEMVGQVRFLSVK
jgi:hypothetical protein